MKTETKYIKLGKKQQIVDLEQFYVNGTIENIDELVKQKKEEIIVKINKFCEEIKDKSIDPNNPYLISTYFFKSINPLANTEPAYSSEKLSIVWQLYMYLIEQVNINIQPFQPTLTHFCKFAGISLSTLRNYKNSSDIQMRILVEKIYDETFESNTTLAQWGRLNSRATLFRLKSENEIQEKPQVNVKVNIDGGELNLKDINKKIADYTTYNSKKNSIKEATIVEVDNE